MLSFGAYKGGAYEIILRVLCIHRQLCKMDALGWILVNICNQMRQWPIYIAASLARDAVLGKDYFIW